MRILLNHLLAILLILTLHNSIFSQEKDIEQRTANFSVSFNGTFIFNSGAKSYRANSANGVYWCNYDIGQVSDEVRELKNFQFFEGNQLLYELKDTPGSDLYISNSGIVAFMDMTHHYNNLLTIHFYSKEGELLFSEQLKGAALFGFSTTGNKFGVGSAKYLKIISVPDHHVETYPGGYQFDLSEDENLVAIATKNKATVYSSGKLFKEFQTGFLYSRKIKISSNNDMLAVIDKKGLNVYSLSTGKLIFRHHLKGKNSYRDLLLKNGKILTGIHYRDHGVSKGILTIYNRLGQIELKKIEATKNFKTFQKQQKLQKSSSLFEQLPWPFVPFDSMHTVWNHYEQHMGTGASSSYLHQGLDIITPIAEPTYAVQAGIVKCVLTLGGAVYWRTAISPVQQPGYSNGWLYAHLIHESIQVDVGDTVQVHDYLGDIIAWDSDWGHIHFVEITDSGLVWQYGDNEWGINYNPLLSLLSPADTVAPIIENISDSSKFAFCTNETSNYLSPDSLYGDIDIIAKVVDYVSDSPWQQPAYETFYWVKKLPMREIVFPRTLGQILNHAYPFYGSSKYQPYATVIYKRDSFLRASSWMSQQRNYYHILTNNNGDSLGDLAEKDLAFATTNYPDGDYRIFVEARDEYGNATVDSMDIKFKNGLTAVSNDFGKQPFKFQLFQNYPNPFNSSTLIRYAIATPGFVRLKIFDINGREIGTLVNEFQSIGNYQVHFNARELASGIYFYELKMRDFSAVKKLIVVR